MHHDCFTSCFCRLLPSVSLSCQRPIATLVWLPLHLHDAGYYTMAVEVGLKAGLKALHACTSWLCICSNVRQLNHRSSMVQPIQWDLWFT